MNPLASTQYALRGTIVTMDASNTVLAGGTVCVSEGKIVSVQPSGVPLPPAFQNILVVDTQGTIYPGLIELHNHLSYDVLPLWNVPKRFDNRDQWTAVPEYHQLVTGPMNVLGKTPGCVQAIVRYVECRCLLGGVTTSQGIALSSNEGIERLYRGLVRNVEEPDDPSLPAAATHILDVEARDAAKFLAALKRHACVLLHLSEGTSSTAHQHFDALHLPDNTWAIAPSLAGIHCVALNADDFKTMHDHGASMVWSPLSNLLLYGQTADIRAARGSGIRIGLGSDWSPSGSKNLLGELKVARLVSKHSADPPVFSDFELVTMATRTAAQILSWDKALGSIETGKLADLLVIDGVNDDPYAHLLEAAETDIVLVIIKGVPRYGTVPFLQNVAPATEAWMIGGSPRILNLAQAVADPTVGALTLGQAHATLQQCLQNLPTLPAPAAASTLKTSKSVASSPKPTWTLVLDHLDDGKTAHRPLLPLPGVRTAAPALKTAASKATPLPLVPLALEPLTVADDKNGFFDRLNQQVNLPAYIKSELPLLY